LTEDHASNLNDCNGWADFWRNNIGMNVIPADTRNKTTNIPWGQWQEKAIPQELHDHWKRANAFGGGLAVILGKAWHRHPDLYLWGIDADNQSAINVICRRNGKHTSVNELSTIFIVEQHEDDPTRLHIYGYSEKPYPKISAGAGVCEVKSQGTHGIMYCTNSIHKNGHRYEILGTLEPTINEELVEHIFHISGNGKDYNDGRIPVKERAKQIHYAGNNRHEELLVYIESLLFNQTFMVVHSDEEVRQYAHDYNNKRNVPPLDDKEFDNVWYDAVRFVNKKKTERDNRHVKENDRNYEEEAIGIIEEASKAIMSKHRILTVEESKEILYFHNGVYVSGGEILIEREAEAMYDYQLSTKAIAEIKGHIMRQTYHKRSEFDSDLNIINLKNRLYNILTGESKPHTPDYLSINQKPILYDPKSKSSLFGKYLNEVLYSAEIRTAVEIMAYTFYRDNPLEIISILFGYGANGKSVFTGLLTCLHGIKNVSNVPLNAIVKNPFALSDLENKDVNIDTELSSATIHDTAILKKLTGRQPVRIERKNQRAYDAALHTKLFFSANKIPQTTDESDAYFRRNVLISFPNKFDEDKADPDLLGKLTTDEEMSGIFNVLMIALRRILNSKAIFVSEKTIQQRRQKYELATNPIVSFIKDAISEESVETDKTTKDLLYHSYKRFCKNNKLAVESKENFGKILKSKRLEEGRESSGERRTIWKGVRLAEEYQIEPDQQTLAV